MKNLRITLFCKYIALALLLSTSSISLAGNKGNFNTQKTYATRTHGIVQPNNNLPETSAPGENPKFTYAELMYQRNYGEDKLGVTGKTVSELLKRSVSEAKYRDIALEKMGDDGWELVSTVTREFTGGFEIFYYFKKQVN